MSKITIDKETAKIALNAIQKVLKGQGPTYSQRDFINAFDIISESITLAEEIDEEKELQALDDVNAKFHNLMERFQNNDMI
jgi:hypothetical protein